MKTALFLLTALVYSMQGVAENLRVEEIEFVSHGATLSGSPCFRSTATFMRRWCSFMDRENRPEI
jgi:hypothetical protein